MHMIQSYFDFQGCVQTFSFLLYNECPNIILINILFEYPIRKPLFVNCVKGPVGNINTSNSLAASAAAQKLEHF